MSPLQTLHTIIPSNHTIHMVHGINRWERWSVAPCIKQWQVAIATWVSHSHYTVLYFASAHFNQSQTATQQAPPIRTHVTYSPTNRSQPYNWLADWCPDCLFSDPCDRALSNVAVWLSSRLLTAQIMWPWVYCQREQATKLRIPTQGGTNQTAVAAAKPVIQGATLFMTTTTM